MPTTQNTRRESNATGAQEWFATDTKNTPTGTPTGRLAHYHARMLADVLAEGTADYWRARAARMLEAQHRPGDYPGRRTPAELEAHNQRMRAAAAACEHRASLEGPGMAVPPLVVAVLLEGIA